MRLSCVQLGCKCRRQHHLHVRFTAESWGNRPGVVVDSFWVLRFRLMVKRGHRFGPQASEGEAQHEAFCWMDVSVNETSVCIVDETGRIVREAKVASEPCRSSVSRHGTCGLFCRRRSTRPTAMTPAVSRR